MPAPAAMDVLVGQAVAILYRGQLIATANRHGCGWSAVVRDRQVEAVTLDGLLTELGVLPDHHAKARR